VILSGWIVVDESPEDGAAIIENRTKPRFRRAVDRYVRATGRRTDLGEMAQHAASEVKVLRGGEMAATASWRQPTHHPARPALALAARAIFPSR
jgi:hypothetical protein